MAILFYVKLKFIFVIKHYYSLQSHDPSEIILIWFIIKFGNSCAA